MPVIVSENRAQSAMMIEGKIDHETNRWLMAQNHSALGPGVRSALQERIAQHASLWYTDEAVASAELNMRKYSVAMDLDVIRQTFLLEEMQSAKPTMRKYLMANPTLRQSWMRGEADGYDGEFEHTVGAVGEDDHVWRSVMSGQEVFDEPSNEYHYTTYHDAEHMDAMDQMMIRQAWVYSDYEMEIEEEDPSSILGNSL